MAKGLCSTHYYRLKRKGVIGGIIAPVAGKGAPSEFLGNVVKNPPQGCVLWPFSLKGKYGALKVGRVSKRAHRQALILATGEDHPELMALHSCGNALCVNPSHLRWGTGAENMEDREKDGRTARLDSNGRAMLSSLQVQTIRKSLADGLKVAALAKLFRVHKNTLWAIKGNKTWKGV